MDAKNSDFVLIDPTAGIIGRQCRDIHLLTTPEQEYSSYLVDLAVSKKDDVEEAVSILENAVKLDSKSVLALIDLAAMYVKIDKTKEAENCLKKAMNMDKSNAAKNTYLDFLLVQSRYSEMEPIIENIKNNDAK